MPGKYRGTVVVSPGPVCIELAQAWRLTGGFGIPTGSENGGGRVAVQHRNARHLHPVQSDRRRHWGTVQEVGTHCNNRAKDSTPGVKSSATSAQ